MNVIASGTNLVSLSETVSIHNYSLKISYFLIITVGIISYPTKGRHQYTLFEIIVYYFMCDINQFLYLCNHLIMFDTWLLIPVLLNYY